MARKSNKTSHVLHLLAGEEPVPETSEDKEESAGADGAGTDNEEMPVQQKNSDQPETGPDVPNISIISTGDSENDPVADLIREQLEEDFPEDILGSQPTTHDGDNGADLGLDPLESPADSNITDTAGLSEAASSDDTAKIHDDSSGADPSETPAPPVPDPSDTPDQTSAPTQTADSDAETLSERTDAAPQAADILTGEPAPVQPDNISTGSIADATEPASGTQQDPPPAQNDLGSVLHPVNGEHPQNFRLVNVMEYLIKDLVIDYMKKFDVCTCDRCMVDTMALALTYCPAKYIVVDSHTVSPLLNYYSNKYLGTVTVELTKACTKIKENPRH